MEHLVEWFRAAGRDPRALMSDGDDRPSASAWLPLRMAAIPLPLRALGWIGFRARLVDGRWKKEPFQIGQPRLPASNSTLAQWRTEGDVLEVQILAPDLFTGFGVALTAEARITFADIDGVRNPETGTITPWAVQLIDDLNSWTELSVSGTGLHVFCLGQLPGPGLVGCLDDVPGQKVEVYDRGRFAYLTGHSLHDPPRPLVDRQKLVTDLAECVGPARRPASSSRFADRADVSIIPFGTQNNTLFRIARSFVRKGVRGTALENALIDVSRRRCVPVPPAAHVIKIARHAEQLPDRGRR
jgi:hypothetical protein